MSVGDTSSLNYNFDWSQGTCKYSYSVKVIEVNTNSDSLPSLFTKSTNSITMSPESSSQIGNYKVDIFGTATYALMQPNVQRCSLNLNVYNCYISQLVYEPIDQIQLPSLSIELYQTTFYTFTKYIQNKQGGGICTEFIKYSTSSSFVSFDSDNKQIIFQPTLVAALGANAMQIYYSIDGYSIQPTTQPEERQTLTFTVKECKVESLVYSQTPEIMVDGGIITTFQFEDYKQKHATGNECQYPTVYFVSFCHSENCTWQELPDWVQFQSQNRKFTFKPAINGNYGNYILKIKSYIPYFTTSTQPTQSPAEDQVINVQVKCSDENLSTLIYQGSQREMNVTQQLGTPITGIKFAKFQNLNNVQCGIQISYEIQVFKSGQLLASVPYFVEFNYTSHQISSSASNKDDIGNYSVQLIPKYSSDQVISSFQGPMPSPLSLTFPKVSVDIFVIGISSFFQPGAYFAQKFDQVTVQDQSQAIVKLPAVICYDLDPCIYQLKADLPKYMTFSLDKTQVVISPRNVSNAPKFQTKVIFKIFAYKNDVIISETNATLSVTIFMAGYKANEPIKNNQTDPTNSTYVIVPEEENNGPDESQKGNQSFLVPFITKMSSTGNVRIYFKTDVVAYNASNVNLKEFLYIQIRRGDVLSAPEEYLNYTVKVVNFEPRFMDIQFQFQYPKNISIGFGEELLIISWENSNFTTINGRKIQRDLKPVILKVPKQMDLGLAQTVEKAGASIQGSLQSIFAINILASIFMSVSLKSMWQLMNICQIICMMGQLFRMPAVADQTIQNINNVIDLKFIPIDWIKKIFLADEENRVDLFKLIDQKIVMLGIAIVIVSITISGLILISKRAGNKTFTSVVDSLKQKIFFNAILRYIVTAYLKLYVTAVQLGQDVYTQSQIRDTQVSARVLSEVFVSQGDKSPFQSLASVLFLVLLTFIPTAILSLLQVNIQELDQPNFKSKIGSLYQGIRKDVFAMTYTTIFCYRRMIVALILLVNIKTGLTLPILYVQQIVYMSYLVAIQPHETKFQNKLEIIGEACILFNLYLMNFFGVQVSIDNQTVGSYIFCGFLALTIISHIGLLIFQTVQNIKKSWTMWRARSEQAAQSLKVQNRQKLSKIREEMIRKRQELFVNDSTPEFLKFDQVQDAKISPLSNNFNQELSTFARNKNNAFRLDTFSDASDQVDLEVQNYKDNKVYEYSGEVSFDGSNPPSVSNRSLQPAADAIISCAKQNHKMRQMYQEYANKSFGVNESQNSSYFNESQEVDDSQNPSQFNDSFKVDGQQKPQFMRQIFFQIEQSPTQRGFSPSQSFQQHKAQFDSIYHPKQIIPTKVEEQDKFVDNNQILQLEEQKEDYFQLQNGPQNYKASPARAWSSRQVLPARDSELLQNDLDSQTSQQTPNASSQSHSQFKKVTSPRQFKNIEQNSEIINTDYSNKVSSLASKIQAMRRLQHYQASEISKLL